ncbi:unnamed protein product [Adineta steineri]|uniref:Uncharacterized protein n=1 Tax=Adineta steineri TaxID=433720 RepID=A0A813SKM7_9BILA|nr:unnamed protein product [Adineta steineri]CAF0794123.1 unnamed protein product [Adineta steineri]CAF0798333.1 unnamed protein product [Adineta steineri]
MALFYVGYVLVVSSTIAFILAILTPRWIYPNVTSVSPSANASNYQGIFFVNLIANNNTCSDWILTYKDSIANCRPPYAVACAALSIVASSLSIILLWLAGGYLYIRRRRLAPHFVTFLAGLTLFIFFTTAVIWIVMLTMNRDGDMKIYRDNIGFSLWIAVGASGGYLLAFILFVLYRIDIGHRSSSHDLYSA